MQMRRSGIRGRGGGGHIVGIGEWRVEFEADTNGRDGGSQRCAVCRQNTTTTTTAAAAAATAAAAAAAAAGGTADDCKDVDGRRPS
jgi:hypothetical protein